MTEGRALCPLCPRACRLKEGEKGFCGARVARGGKVQLEPYGFLSSLALDPIEKKPLAYFRPGSMILSCGFYGCNMRCPFCQNYHISFERGPGETYEPAELVALAESLVPEGSCGIAFTYNEPLLAFEYIEETFRLCRARGLETVLVTNGNFLPDTIRRIAPLVSAWNIDLKCFTEEGYQKLGGDFGCVKEAIRIAREYSHVEVTTLVVPGLSDSPDDMAREADWLASVDPAIPLHLSRYFPRYKQKSGAPTSVPLLYRLRDIAKTRLKYVKLGNI